MRRAAEIVRAKAALYPAVEGMTLAAPSALLDAAMAIEESADGGRNARLERERTYDQILAALRLAGLDDAAAIVAKWKSISGRFPENAAGMAEPVVCGNEAWPPSEGDVWRDKEGVEWTFTGVNWDGGEMGRGYQAAMKKGGDTFAGAFYDRAPEVGTIAFVRAASSDTPGPKVSK